MIADFRDFCLLCYVVIDDLYKQLAPLLAHRPGPSAECSDSELLTMALVGECREWHKETSLLANFKLFPDLFPNQPSRTRFNRRRRNLALVLNLMRQALLVALDVAQDSQAAIDSLPIPVINFHLVPHSRNDWKAYGASYGKVCSKKQTIFGYKLHLLVTLNGVILDFELAPANADDRYVGRELLEGHYGLQVLADKAYISRPIAQELGHQQKVQLVTLPRSNQKSQVRSEHRQRHNHFRQIVETVNGQLAEQFAIEENYAHTWWSLVSRLYTKLTAHTLCIYLNRLLGNANFLQIKPLAFPEAL